MADTLIETGYVKDQRKKDIRDLLDAGIQK